MVDMLNSGMLYPSLGLSVDAHVVYVAVAAVDKCEPAGCNLKPQLFPAKNRLEQDIIGRFHWVDHGAC